MNFRQTIRENWDVGVWVIAIGLILGWALFAAFLSPLMGQTAPRAIVTWDAIPPALNPQGYLVKRATSPTNTPTVFNVGLVTRWQDDGIEPTTKYWYSVAGFDLLGREGETAVNSTNPFRFSDIQPASPANLTATKQTAQGRVTVFLNWTSVTKTRSLLLLPGEAVISYKVFMTSTQGTGNAGVTNATSFQVSGLKKNQTVYFYLTAIWNSIESLGSPAIRVQT